MRTGCVMRRFDFAVCSVAMMWSVWLGSATSVADDHLAPNIIVMMADDMGMGDTSAYQDITGNADDVQVQTPQMERLARMGIRFTDAHSPSSRCTATRAALLTGRYTWRTYLKYSVLWSPQGNPLIEPTRPTLATLLADQGYRCGMSGKWHCGLMYRNADGEPEADYAKVDYRQGLADGPLDHGFDFFHGTARSHPTSRLQGWLYGSTIPAATGPLTVDKAEYVLNETGPTNYRMAQKFLDDHFANEQFRQRPFFLYYACHSNHASYDPCVEIEGRKVKGQSSVGSKRGDFVYENDVALGLLLDYLDRDDPRRPGHKLIDNTLVVFTSDNGAERNRKASTGPFRSNKASVYEGGHRVPFIAAWKAGGVGDGDAADAGQTSHFPICHVDLFATFAEILNVPMPQDGAEDSFSILPALRGDPPAAATRLPMIHHDHKEGAPPKKSNHPTAAWLAIRMDDPVVEGVEVPGQWKLFVDEQLLLGGKTNPRELYDLRRDQREATNLIEQPDLAKLVSYLAGELTSIHNRGGIRK